jgi:H+/Cl- antiporter ClcA
MGIHVIVTGGAASGYAMLFCSPMMSALFGRRMLYPRMMQTPSYGCAFGYVLAKPHTRSFSLDIYHIAAE